MRAVRRINIITIFVLVLTVAFSLGADFSKKPVNTTVMSFNIGSTHNQGGDNNWDDRRYLVRRAIRDFKPALFGVQECRWEQGVELNEAFYGYRITGVGRDDGVQAGEMCLIFTRHDRYHLLDQGFFWLSETPDEPGSKGWDASSPNIVSWVKLRDRWCNPDTVFVFNTQLDQAGKESRHQGALLLQKQMADISRGQAVILLGDFNSPATSQSPSYRVLAEEGYLADLALRDAWMFSSPEEPMQREDTFHGYTGEGSRGRIDWILTSAEFPGVEAGIQRVQKNGQYPSDHFPIWATFRLERHPPLPGDEVDTSTGATPKY